MTYDPATGGFIGVKELTPQGVFQTTIDFVAGTASNGSPSTANSINLFDPALLGVDDLADVFALSNIIDPAGGDYQHVLYLSQASGRIVEADRSGNVHGTLSISLEPGDPPSPLSIADMQHEGLTMDTDGRLYVVSENGGGDINHPELWVYAPVPEPEQYATMAGLGALAYGMFRRHRTSGRAA